MTINGLIMGIFIGIFAGGFLGLLSPIVSIGKKLLGFNDKILETRGGFIGTLLNLGKKILGFGDDVFKDDDEDILKKFRPIILLLTDEKNNKKVDAYLYALTKLSLDDDVNEDKLKMVYYKTLYDYDKRYRPDLFKRRENTFYKGSFSPALLGLIPSALQFIPNMITSISNAIRGHGEDKMSCQTKKNVKDFKGGKVMTLSELKEIQKQID